MDSDAMDAETNPDATEIDSNRFLSSLNPFASRKVVEMPVARYDDEYNMKHKNRGIALVFNHKEFNPRLKLMPRHGTDKDVANFKKALEVLGFTSIYVHNDLSVDKVKNEIDRVRNLDHSDNDCLVVAVFTHGLQNSIYAYDGSMTPEEIWEPFVGKLVGKPKLFFIQACQGQRFDSGVRVLDKTDSNSVPYKIPSYADFLIYYSTIPGFYSWRNTTEGSWFVQSLCIIFYQHGQSLDLLTLLTLVNQKVALEFESFVPEHAEISQKKQIPCFTSMLTRKLFFLPKDI